MADPEQTQTAELRELDIQRKRMELEEREAALEAKKRRGALAERVIIWLISGSALGLGVTELTGTDKDPRTDKAYAALAEKLHEQEVALARLEQATAMLLSARQQRPAGWSAFALPQAQPPNEDALRKMEAALRAAQGTRAPLPPAAEVLGSEPKD